MTRTIEEIYEKVVEVKTELRELRSDVQELKTMYAKLNSAGRAHEVELAKIKASNKYIIATISLVSGLFAGVIGALLVRLLG